MGSKEFPHGKIDLGSGCSKTPHELITFDEAVNSLRRFLGKIWQAGSPLLS